MSDHRKSERVYPAVKIAVIVDALAAEGVPAVAALQGVGLTAQEIASPNTRVSRGDMIQCCRNAIKLTRDPFLGYRAGLNVHVTTFGIYGLAILSSPDFRQTMALPSKYLELSTPLANISFQEVNHRGIWSVDPTLFPAIDPSLYRFLVESQFGTLTSVLGDAIGPAFAPLELQVTYGPSVDLRTYKKVFGCSVRFRQPANRLIFDAAWLDATPRFANRITFSEALKLCDAHLAQLQSRKGVAGLVRQLLLQDVARPPRLEAVAREQKTSARTLRRRLQAENTSFRALVEDVRARAAIDYLRDPNLTVEHVAERLGFSDASNFHHAVRRWTNYSPGELRDRWTSTAMNQEQSR